MKFRERIAPSNGTETAFYKVIGAISILVILTVISPFLGPLGKLFFALMIGFGLLNFIACPYIRKIRNNYQTTSITAYFVGLVSIFVTIMIYFSMFVVIVLPLYIIESLVISAYVDILDIVSSVVFFALMIFIAFLIGKTEPVITRFFAERVWHLNPNEVVNSET